MVLIADINRFLLICGQCYWYITIPFEKFIEHKVKKEFFCKTWLIFYLPFFRKTFKFPVSRASFKTRPEALTFSGISSYKSSM